MSAPVFLADADVLTEGAAITLTGAEAYHAAAALRLRVGEIVVVTDGRGLAVSGPVASVSREAVVVDVARRDQRPAPQPRVVVAQGLPKGDRGERAVELLTEVGVDEVVPWAATRCVTVWRGERGERALAKWRSSATAAAKQSRRWWHPVVSAASDTPALVDRVARAALAVVLHEEAERPLTQIELPTEGEVLLVVGPEGGIADDERDRLVGSGAIVAGLGPTVLRTSTAGAIAAALVVSRTPRWG